MNYEQFRTLPRGLLHELDMLLSLKLKYQLQFTSEENSLYENFCKLQNEMNEAQKHMSNVGFLENCLSMK